MILDLLENAPLYHSLHPGFAEGFAFLRRDDIGGLSDGRYEIDGERVFAIVSRSKGRGREQSSLETHHRYIDIQCVITGEESIGWLPKSKCRTASSPHDPERDIAFFSDAPLTWLSLPTGTFAVFFPDDAHAPLAGLGTVHKAVVKVAVAG
ncbi:MAG: DUF386 domain-containing protein [Pirellulaceae bacterium]|nr:DUF386 domain-containing protein [Pirellulaceae bacterium]